MKKDKEQIKRELLKKIEKINRKFSVPKKKEVLDKAKENSFIQNGIEDKNEFGTFFYIENQFSFGNLPYNINFKNIYHLDPVFIEKITDEKTTYKDWVALDIETSGLLKDNENFAFLVGLCYINDNNTLSVRQYFMRDLGEEKAMLLGLLDFLENFSLILTYNGRIFDIPVLRERIYKNGIFILDIGKLPHFDIYQFSKNFYKHSPSKKLQFFEQDLLNFVRKGDIPGSEIPEVYLRFIGSKNYSIVEGVIWHNIWDVITLFGLMLKIEEEYENFPQNDIRTLINILVIFYDDQKIINIGYNELKKRKLEQLEEKEFLKSASFFKKKKLSNIAILLCEKGIINGIEDEKFISEYLIISYKEKKISPKILSILTEVNLSEKNKKRLNKIIKVV
jgi:uncharacterized protein YprB with RNaseH-like and TPR domain